MRFWTAGRWMDWALWGWGLGVLFCPGGARRPDVPSVCAGGSTLEVVVRSVASSSGPVACRVVGQVTVVVFGQPGSLNSRRHVSREW